MKRLCLLLIFLALGFAASGQMIVSILYFENTTQNKDYDWLCKALTDMLITDISASADLQVIEREEIETIIREQEKSFTDIYSEENVIKLGNMLNCSQVLYGSFIIFQQNIRIDAKLVDIETGKILNTAQSAGEIQELFVIQKDLTVNLLVAMAVDIPETIEYFETESLKAAEAYYTGLNFLDQGEFEDAAQYFRMASQIDPYYVKPQKSLEEAYQFLKDFKKSGSPFGG